MTDGLDEERLIDENRGELHEALCQRFGVSTKAAVARAMGLPSQHYNDMIGERKWKLAKLLVFTQRAGLSVRLEGWTVRYEWRSPDQPSLEDRVEHLEHLVEASMDTDP